MARNTSKKRKSSSDIDYKKKYKKYKKSYKDAKATNKKYSKSKKSKNSLTGVANKVGNTHWLSFGGAVHRKYCKRLPKKLVKAMAPSFLYRNDTGVMQPTAGTQLATLVSTVYDQTDIQRIARETYQIAVNAGAAAATNYSGPASLSNTTNPPLKTILESCSVKLGMTNQSNAPVFIDVYDILARKDIHGINPVSAWDQGLGNIGTTGGESLPGTVATTSSMYGVTPFASEKFTVNWKVLKMTRINLASGETAEHILHVQPMKLWNDVVDEQVEYYRGLSHTILVVVRGAITDGNNSTVGSANTKVDYCVTKQYRYTTLQSNVTTFYNSANNLSTAAQQIFDVGAGASQALAAA